MILSIKTNAIVLLILTIFNIKAYSKPVFKLHDFKYTEEIDRYLIRKGRNGGIKARRVSLPR